MSWVGFADPSVLKDGPRWYAYATAGNGNRLQVMRSDDLLSWSPPGEAISGLPGWAEDGRNWSPSCGKFGDHYAFWYAVRVGGTERQGISVGLAESAGGPFVDSSAGPAIFQQEIGGSIDPSVFVDVDGSAYLLWKADSNAVGRASTLWAAPLGPDGDRLAAQPTLLLSKDAPWEGPLIEAPSMVHRDDLYYLFYSANAWNTPRYGIGFATGPSPLGPFKKRTKAYPWMASNQHLAGPGGQEFSTDREGNLVIAFHAWEPDKVGMRNGGDRRLHLAHLQFSDQGPSLLEHPTRLPRHWWPFR